jgi:hypothetical protein
MNTEHNWETNANNSESLAEKTKNYKSRRKSPVRVFTKIVQKDVYIRPYALHSSQFHQHSVLRSPHLSALDEVCRKRPVPRYSNGESN